MEVDLLRVPYESGRRGVRMGAGSLRLVESGLVDHLAGLGHDVRLVPVEHECEFPTEVAAAFELARKIREKVTESREERRLPVVLAGNCISAVGTMAALPSDLYGSGPRWVRICRTTTTRPLTEQSHHCSHQHKPNKRRSMRSEMTPNLKERPDHLTLEKHMKANAAGLYKAWTEHFDLWFAQPGELIMAPEIDKPFFFYNRHDWGRNAHYGRFLELEQDRLIEMTWLTGKGGTFGAETVIRIELIPQDQGTMVRMTHSGFDDEKAAKAHKDNWPLALDELDRKLTT